MACAVILGIMALTCSGAGIFSKWRCTEGRAGRRGAGCFPAWPLCLATAISFARRWPNSLLFAYPSGGLLIVWRRC